MANPPFPSAILTTADQNPLTTKRYFLILKLRIFTYHELSAATNGGNFLGKGSQGRDYKAFLDGGGQLDGYPLARSSPWDGQLNICYCVDEAAGRRVHA
ncbi:hypothetical protein F2Q70_00021169 [Brassica cretica]|uniref:Uncharacterized protein n=1 Tax=Brassica cretica TaxID=69181 RepID=A0A3N6R0W7_BRACR|nr:hypothetical protein F2Q70_00021169 [Brassica cretica]KAF3606615.1 hypothetical protein DY000_02047252 [Brassica cretica]